jgi:UPF0271 protein
MRVLLDIDLGELPDEPDELYALAHVANIACGGHAGDADTIDRALSLAKTRGTRVGAHPSYPDRAGFGRRALDIDVDALTASIREQLTLLRDRALQACMSIGHVKAHGALYHAIDRDESLADECIAAFVEVLGHVEVLGPPGGATQHASAAAGLPFLAEGFADRGLMPGGSLVPRGQPGALIEDAARARAQATSLAESGRYGVLCVHGDGAHAIVIARAVREALDLLNA